MQLKNRFKALYCLKSVANSTVAQAYLDFFKKHQIPFFFINSENDVPSDSNPKETLILTVRKGGFVNRCPCSPNVICCGYANINLAEGCPFACNYCALDIYLKKPATRIFTNLEDLETELKEFLLKNKQVRIGTGELSDSLVWDEIFPYSRYLMKFFESHPDAILEFKTKSVQIERFLEIPAQKNILISWSVNTPKKISEEEDFVSSLDERITAAKQVSAHGYKVGFHFDPVYSYPGYQKDYSETVEKIFKNFSNSQIGWVSIGLVRFNPDLKEVLIRRNSKILELELFPSFYDGKMRIFYQERKKAFLFLVNEIKKHTHKIYLCMEPELMWDEVPLNMKNLNQRIFTEFFE